MSFNMRLIDVPPTKSDAFPDHEFKHGYELIDDNDKPTGKRWCAGERFEWEKELLPTKPDTGWFAFRQDINALIDDTLDFREKHVPRLQVKEEAIAKKVKDLSFHLEVRKKDIGVAVNRNVCNRSAYYTLRDYEARFTLLHGLGQLAQVQSQVIDLLTACVIRRIQARLRWLLPLFCKVGLRKPDGPDEKLNEMVDEEPYFELYVWHPYTDDKGNILEDHLEPDSMRDYPMILQKLMDPKKYQKAVLERKAAAERAVEGKVMIAGEGDVRSMVDFQKKFGGQLGRLAKK